MNRSLTIKQREIINMIYPHMKNKGLLDIIKEVN